jgi:hypothetical protein
MSSSVSFAYAQVRLQARFGERPDEAVWQRLHSVGELGSYLQTARQTTLRKWVLGISPTHDSHVIELALRQKFRAHIDEVANWPPHPWQAALQWIKCLPDLPALQHLLNGDTAAAWMQRDPLLADIADTDAVMRLQTLHTLDFAVLAESVRRGDTLFQGWLQRWRELRPKPGNTDAHFDQGLKHLEALLHAQLMPPPQGMTTSMLRESLAHRLRTAFRRYRFQPATSCAYLALTALDLERLRGDLLQRALFSNACETSL